MLVAVAVNDGLSVSSLSKEADTETKLLSISSTVRLATINEFFMDILIGTDENFNGQQTALRIKVTVPSNAVSFAFQSSKVAVEVTAVNDAPVINIISNSSLWGEVLSHCHLFTYWIWIAAKETLSGGSI